jgi:hypothetical protein
MFSTSFFDYKLHLPSAWRRTPHGWCLRLRWLVWHTTVPAQGWWLCVLSIPTSSLGLFLHCQVMMTALKLSDVWSTCDRAVNRLLSTGRWFNLELPQSWCPSHVFLPAERVQNIQGKFAHEIVATADSRLRQHVVCTASPYILLPW